MSNPVRPDSVCSQFQQAALLAVNQWDGGSTAELFLAILAKTGEDVRDTLEEAGYIWSHQDGAKS